MLEQRNEEGLSYRFSYEAHPDAPTDPTHSLTRVRDSLGREDVYAFKGEGGLKRLVHHQRPDGSTLAYKYNAYGQLTGQTDPLGRTTWMPRDGDGRLLAIRSPIAEAVELKYNPQGLLIERRIGQQGTRYLYDSHQRLIQLTHPDGSTQQYRYVDLKQASAESRLTAEYPIQIEDAQGGLKHLSWSATGQLLSHTDCSHRTTRYEYTREGLLTAILQADDSWVQYRYNPQHQLERVRYADGSGEQYAYDATGRLVCIQVLEQEQEPVHGQDITLAYDLWGRIIHRNHAGTSLQFAYDPRGLLSELINENHARSQFEWDAMDRLIKETGVDGRTQHYHYNAMGLLTGQDDGQDGHWCSQAYHYDDKDNLTVRRWGNLDSQSEVAQPADLPEYLRARPNPAFEQRFEWDEQRHLSKAQLYAGHGEQARLEAECLFEYSPAGLLTTETQRIWDSTLQPEPKLLHEYRLEHQHDVLGNRTQSVLPDVGELGILRYGAGHVQGIALNHHALLDIHRDALHREVKRQWLSDETDHTRATLGSKGSTASTHLSALTRTLGLNAESVRTSTRPRRARRFAQPAAPPLPLRCLGPTDG